MFLLETLVFWEIFPGRAKTENKVAVFRLSEVSGINFDSLFLNDSQNVALVVAAG